MTRMKNFLKTNVTVFLPVWISIVVTRGSSGGTKLGRPLIPPRGRHTGTGPVRVEWKCLGLARNFLIFRKVCKSSPCVRLHYVLCGIEVGRTLSPVACVRQLRRHPRNGLESTREVGKTQNTKVRVHTSSSKKKWWVHIVFTIYHSKA